MKTKIRQIFYDLRTQPVIAWVSFVATALSIFLVMVIVITQMVKQVPFAPESCRDRLLVGAFMHIKSSDGDGSSGLSFKSARILYDNLEGVEEVSYFTFWPQTSEVRSADGESFDAIMRNVDANFFKIFDHQLVRGRYFTQAESDAVLPLAIVSESTARNAFGDVDPIGAKIAVDQKAYTVVGVVKDNSTLATTACGDVFLVTGPKDKSLVWSDMMKDSYFGPLAAALLVKEGVDFQSVRNQVKARYAILDTELKSENSATIYHEAPYDQATIAHGLAGSNNTPDTSSEYILYCIIIGVLLLIPAINLSSMLHSRLCRRVSELGVRRAFGCTRGRIIRDIIAENFIVTMAGGIVGVIAGVIFASTYTGLYENMETFGRATTPPLSAVLDWTTILIAIALCFILNLISASVPAWQASRLNPVNAINSK